MREKIKTSLLIINIVLLGSLFFISLTIGLEPKSTSGPIYAITRLIRGDGAPKKVETEAIFAASNPIKMSVVTREGMYAACTGNQIEPLYERARPLINESIGSASVSKEITAEEYSRVALHGTSICLEYDGKIPLYAFRIWGGASGIGFDYSVRVLNICLDGDKIVIAFYDYNTDKFYMCSTSSDVDTFEGAVAGVVPNGAYFAAADKSFSALVADEVICPETLTLPVYSVELPAYVTQGELPRGVLDAFSMSQYLTNVYDDADNARVYVQSDSTLRLERDGTLVYTASSDIEATGGGDLEKKIALADHVRKMAESTFETGDNTNVYLKEITQTRNGEYEIIFSRECGGIPIGGSAEKPIFARVKNDAIVYFEMNIYNLSQVGEDTVLPYKQAIAALPNGSERLRFSVRYGAVDGKLTPYLAKSHD